MKEKVELHIGIWCLGWLRIIEGFAILLSLGFYTPTLALKATEYLGKKFGKHS